MKNLRLSILFLLGLGYTFSFAQHSGVMSVLLKSQEYYDTHSNLSVDVTYKMYESYESSKLIENMNGGFKTVNGNMYCRLGNQVQLKNSKWCVVADGTTQTMLVQENRNTKPARTPLGIDSLVNLYRETGIIKDDGETVTLLFSKPKTASYTVSRFTVDIEKKSGRILSAVLYYAFDLNNFYEDIKKQTIPRIEIIYTNYMENNSSESDFHESEYFFISGEKIKPAGAYSAYTVIDLRSTKKIH